MKRVHLAVTATLVITLLVILMSLLIPVPSNNNPFEFYFNLAFAEATALFSIGASVVIIMGLAAFTKQFRRAYTIMFTGLIIWGVSYLQLPLMVIFDLLSNDIAISASTIPFIGSVILIFVGTRMLAKLFNVNTIYTQWWFPFAIIIIVSTLVTLSPHVPSPSEELPFDMVNILIMTASTFFAICAYNILLIKKQAGITFTNAFAWLCISMFVTAFFGGFGSTISSMFLGQEFSQFTNALAIVPSCIGAALFLRSAYSFNQITESTDVQGQFVARDFFGNPSLLAEHDHLTSVDIVVYAATLVSNPAAIDNLLITVRAITARLLLHPETTLSYADEEALRQVYLKIEEYLITTEAIRKFTKEGLRQNIAQKLHITPESPQTIWNKLT